MDAKYRAFLRVLDPEDNVTGGGAASAVAGSMGAALVGMSARVSIGKKGMVEPDEFYRQADEEARELVEKLLEGSQADSEAFDAVMAAYRLPKETEADKTARSAAIQAATIGATEVPLQIAARCAAVLELANRLTGRSNINVASDLECGVFLAQAGLKGALSNATINIESIKDEETAARLQARVNGLRSALGD